jgi:plasmid stabilization system protein ParE
MAEISWTDEAAVWLEDIYKFIAEDNPDAAGRVAEGIYRKVQILSKFWVSSTVPSIWGVIYKEKECPRR